MAFFDKLVTIFFTLALLANANANANAKNENNGKQNNAHYPTIALIKKITASSFLIDKRASYFSYHPTNLYDENNNTAWFEGANGNGINEYIEIEFFSPLDITSITIGNGYGKSSSLFSKNGRIKSLDIKNSNNNTTLNLKDTYHPQGFSLNIKKAKKIRLTIKDVYPGEKYHDVGFSEITINGYPSEDTSNIISAFELEELYKAYQSRAAYDEKMASKLSKLNSQQLYSLLNREFQSSRTNDDRLWEFIKQIKSNPILIPAFLKAALYAKESVFLSTNPNVKLHNIDVATEIWGQSDAGIPFVKHKIVNPYAHYYYLLQKGDTRVLTQYLNTLKNEGVSHEYCCDVEPYNLISSNREERTAEILQTFMSENSLDSEVEIEIKKALKSLDKN